MRIQILLGGALLLSSSGVALFAQPVAEDIGYQRPLRLLAPGQVITVFVSGLDLPDNTDAHATGLPLPLELGGVSAFLVQRAQVLDPFENAARLFRVFTFPDCSRADVNQSCVQKAAVTLQIPFEAAAIGPRPFPLFSDLVFAVNGVRGPAVGVEMIAASVHVLRTCDTTDPAYDPLSPPFCEPILTTIDGEPVGNSFRPARPDDVVVVWAFGLGITDPAVPSGMASPNPPAVTRDLGNTIYLFEFPTLGAGATVASQPTFVGLAPGFVGLYQINMPVPQVSGELPPCREGIYSNTRLTIVGGLGLVGDSVDLCIDP